MKTLCWTNFHEKYIKNFENVNLRDKSKIKIENLHSCFWYSSNFYKIYGVGMTVELQNFDFENFQCT